MIRFQNIPIRRKILISMLAFTLIPIVLVAAVALTITYSTMRDQLIYDRRMSVGWLQDRLSIEISGITDQLYQFEVDKLIRADLVNWCVQGAEPDYTARLRMINLMNSTISLDSRLNSIDIYNIGRNQVLTAKRSGAELKEADGSLSVLAGSLDASQSNLVFFRNGTEILAAHQVRRFEDKTPYALVVLHFRPYQLEHIVSRIKTTDEDTLLIYNNHNELLIADYGKGRETDPEIPDRLRDTLAAGERKEARQAGSFWFYRSAGSGKMQILMSVPDRTIVNALLPTFISGLAVALVAIAASLICSVLYSRAVSNPIQKLSEHIKTLTLNRFSGSFSEKRRDEVGILQESFDIMIARNQELIRNEYQSKIEKRNAQLRALQAQINPHFMYNTLQVIGGMALKKQAPEIYEMTVALGDILRYSLNFQADMVPLSEELEYLNSYLLIQNRRHNGRIQLIRDIAPETLNCLIPKLILQPLAENSFTHGFANKAGEWILHLKTRLEGEKLMIGIRDNGTGMTPERLEEIRGILAHDTENVLRGRSHIGLSNVHARIRLKDPDPAYGVTIESTPGEGTTVFVCIRCAEGNQD